MPRISEIEAACLPADAQEIYHRFITDYGPFENQVKIFAQRPPALRHIMGLLLELADDAVLPKRYLEIALVTVSKLNACEYCVAHHGPRMTSQGLDARAFEQLLDDEVPGFDEVDHAVERANSLSVAFQAAVFSKDVKTSVQTARNLNATAVMINDHSAFRVDWMPFAGRKTSGLGIGGIGYTMDDLSEDKMIVLNYS